MQQKRNAKALLVPALITTVAVALLVWLGVWQLQRLGWKQDIIARMSARINAQPVAIPPENAWSPLKPEDYDYRHVVVSGVYDGGVTAFIFRASAPLKSGGGEGAGYFMLTPLRLADGSHVLVNRGFLPRQFRATLPASAEAPSGVVTVTGLMRPPETRNVFTPADEPANSLWYTRDPASVATRYKLARTAPFVIDEDVAPEAKGWPRGGATEVVITNHHLIYALTWFSLAITLLAVFGVWARGHVRRNKD